MPVQIFGTKKSAATRKAQRFFAERRVPVHFVDLAERAASKGELQRFAQKFGVESLIDRESRRFQELGLGPADMAQTAGSRFLPMSRFCWYSRWFAAPTT